MTSLPRTTGTAPTSSSATEEAPALAPCHSRDGAVPPGRARSRRQRGGGFLGAELLPTAAGCRCAAMPGGRAPAAGAGPSPADPGAVVRAGRGRRRDERRRGRLASNVSRSEDSSTGDTSGAATSSGSSDSNGSSERSEDSSSGGSCASGNDAESEGLDNETAATASSAVDVGLAAALSAVDASLVTASFAVDANLATRRDHGHGHTGGGLRSLPPRAWPKKGPMRSLPLRLADYQRPPRRSRRGLAVVLLLASGGRADAAGARPPWHSDAACQFLPERPCAAHGDRCRWHAKSGCFALPGVVQPSHTSHCGGDDDDAEASGDGPIVDIVQLSSAAGGGGGEAVDCLSADREECEAHPTRCTWDKKRRCEFVGGGGAGGAGAVEAVDCPSAGKEECQAHPTRCAWDKKRKCEFVGAGGAASVRAVSVRATSHRAIDCAALGREECEAHARGCAWDKKRRCESRADGVGALRIVEAVDCPSAGKEECEARPTQCTWDKKRKCEFVGAAGASQAVDCFSADKEECEAHPTKCTWHKKTKCGPCTECMTAHGAPGGLASSAAASGDGAGAPAEETWWYYDPNDGGCKPDGPGRPAWIGTVHDRYDECCEESWDAAGCLASARGGENSSGGTSEDGAEEAESEGRPAWYYDTGDGQCKPNGKQRPTWLTLIFDEYETCCLQSWDNSACLLSEHNPGKNDSESSKSDDGSSDASPSKTDASASSGGRVNEQPAAILLDLNLFGTVDLHLASLPPRTSRYWKRLKRVLMTSLALLMADDSALVHPEYMEVDLWSIAGVEFTSRKRGLGEDGSEEEADEGRMEVEEEEVTLSSSSLRGTKSIAVQKERQQQRQRRRKDIALYKLKFELALVTKCNSVCQSDTRSALGKLPATLIDDYFQTAISSGAFALLLENKGKAMGIFVDSVPSASNGKLSYLKATRSILNDDEDVTWPPSDRPTAFPTYVTYAPTLDVYYPDVVDMVCRSGDGAWLTNQKFGSVHECCQSLPKYTDCMRNAERATRPTCRPTRRPTPVPTTPVPTRRPTPEPTRQPTTPKPVKRKTPRPTKMPASPAGQGGQGTSGGRPMQLNSGGTGGGGGGFSSEGVVYYPDLKLGVCKFDGLHGNNPYQFKTAAKCCTNQWMDYTKCMAFADPYHDQSRIRFYPDIYAGYCKSDGGHTGLDDRMVYDNKEDCCDNAWMMKDFCLDQSVEGIMPSYQNPATPSTPASSVAAQPTPLPTPSQNTGQFYPDFHAGLCLDDGKQTSQAFTFDTLDACCAIKLMDYQDCITYSIEMRKSSTNNPCTWHPNPNAFGKCTYGSLYPDSWAAADKRDTYLFATHETCCQISFGGPGCAMDYNCNGEKSGPTPTGYVTLAPITSYPTFAPTAEDWEDGPEPTTSLTEKPTITPTAKLTQKPTEQPKTKPTPLPTRQQNSISVPAPQSQPSPGSTGPANGLPKPTLPPSIGADIDATGFVGMITDGFEEGLTGRFPWSTSEDFPWTTYEADKTKGKFSARSHPVDAGKRSDLELAIKSKHGGVLIFDIKSDVKMPFTGCYVNLDGKTVTGYTNPTPDWIKFIAVKVPPGDRIVTFRSWAPAIGGSTKYPGVSGTIGLDNVSYTPTLFDSFEDGKLEWEGDLKFQGPGKWKIVSTEAHEGSFSLMSPTDLEKGQSNSMELELTMPQWGGTLSFWYRSTLNGDMFSLFMGGTSVLMFDQSKEWTEFKSVMPPGKNKLTWAFAKSGAGGAIWIDEIRIEVHF